MSVPVTPGTGASSVAAELVGGLNYQQIEIYGAGGSSVLSINPDGSLKASIIGIPTVTFSGSPSISGAVTVIGTPSINAIQSGPWSTSLVGSAIPDSSVFGTITSVQSVSVVANGYGTVGVGITGSFTGTINFQGTVDGSTWNPTTVVQLSNGTIVSSATGPFMGQANSAGLSGFRAIGNTVTVGAASVILRASGTTATVMLDNPLPAGTNNIGQVTASVSGTITASIQGNVNVASIIGAITPYAQPGTYIAGAPSVITSTSSVQVLAAPSAPQRNYITQLLVTNVSGVGTTVNIVDGGSVIYTGYAAASGGGFSASFPVPLKQPTSVLGLYAATSATSSVLISASGYTAP